MGQIRVIEFCLSWGLGVLMNMDIRQNMLLIIALVLIGAANFKSQAKLRGFAYDADCSYELSGICKEEMFYGKNISLLNNYNDCDRVLYWRHIFDVSLDVAYGAKTYGHQAMEFYCTMRNRGVWGNPKGIAATTTSSVKLSETVFGDHSHSIPRHVVWIRELWMKMDLGDIFHLALPNRHTFTLGAFKFELGRGISLGSAYAVGHQLLGFYTEDIIDQYAFGGKLSGFIINPVLTYDLYAALLNNKSSSLGDTSEHVYAQQYGMLSHPERGFGKVAFLVAGRAIWAPLCSQTCGKLNIEPYWLYYNEPEQRVERLGDAKTVMGTVGFASEYEGERFAGGFDWAVNIGYQNVKGLDRNTVTINNISGSLIEVNTHVEYKKNESDPKRTAKRMPYIPGKIQNKIYDVTQSEMQNGALIAQVDMPVYGSATTDRVFMYNAKNRFRDPYVNRLNGWMFVADAALKTSDDMFQIAGTVGYASGDENPNTGNKDGVYSGFIGIQEIYWGKRVRSAFLLGGAGRLQRPMSLPVSKRQGRFASAVSNFTNISFVGMAINKKKMWQDERKLTFNPNILVYWQDEPSPCFDLVTKKDLNGKAEQFLGTELNLFVDYWVMKNLKLYFVASVYIPGGHFDDIKGKPISAAQVRALDRVDRSGFNNEYVPNIGSDSAATFNFGIEYIF
jgi:hypothetical protein